MMKLEKIAIVLSAVALICSLTLLILQLQIPSVTEIQNPKIFCPAIEYHSTNWYHSEHNPSYFSSENIELGVSVTNNVSSTLFNFQVVVSYKTASDTWETTSRNMGILDIGQTRETRISLSNPELWIWAINTPSYPNVTRYVLNATNYKITSYGFASP